MMDCIEKDRDLPYTVRPFLPWRFHCWSIWLLNLLAKVTVTSSLTKTSTESSTSTSATWKWRRKILRSQASKCEVSAAISIHYNVPLPHGQQPPWKSQLHQNENSCLNIPQGFWCWGSSHHLLHIGSIWCSVLQSNNLSVGIYYHHCRDLVGKKHGGSTRNKCVCEAERPL